MLRAIRLAWLLSWVLLAQAATLEYLSTDDMIDRSTAIVRGRVVGSGSNVHGPLIYTHYSILVQERLKGPESTQLDVVVPGGVFQGQRQTFAGSPALSAGSEYLLFLWTGTSGLTHVIGLSQGVFTLERSPSGEVTATRRPSAEAMFDAKTGRAVEDQSVRLKLADLRARVRGRVQTGGSGR